MYGLDCQGILRLIETFAQWAQKDPKDWMFWDLYNLAFRALFECGVIK